MQGGMWFGAGLQMLAEDRSRAAGRVARLCGLEADRDVWACGARSCVYYDDDALRCGLLVRDIPARVDDKTLRWLLGRKRIDHDALDEILAVRSGSL